MFATRRKRPIPDGWATGEDISAFDVAATADAIYPGSTSVSVNASGDQVIFGGSDGVAGVYSLPEQKLLYTLQAGSPVTATAWCGDRAAIGTVSGVTKIFEAGTEVAELASHAGPVTDLAVHPSGAILASVGADKRFIFHSLQNFQSVSSAYTDADITCCDFHVDGLLFFTGGSDGNIRIFDVKTSGPMAVMEAGGPVRAVSFSENGTWFAVAIKGSSTVAVWDIRKQAPLKTFDVGSPIDSVRFDYTGQFLATAGSGSVSVQQWTKSSKSWSEPLRKAVQARDVVWGGSATSLVALTPEGGLSILSAS